MAAASSTLNYCRPELVGSVATYVYLLLYWLQMFQTFLSVGERVRTQPLLQCGRVYVT